jgi:hypothetical protein
MIDADDQVRADPITDARRRVRELAAEGYIAGEIMARLDHGLEETERYVLWRLARDETARARRTRIQRELERRDVDAA